MRGAADSQRIEAQLTAIRSVQARHETALEQILELLRQRTSTSDLDDRLLAALRMAMDDFDLSFDAREVLQAATSSHALAEALQASGLSDAAAVGAKFRALRQAGHLIRDGRAWRFART